MADLISDDGRIHIRSQLMRESLVDKRVLQTTFCRQEFKILPDVIAVHLGGRSVFDRPVEVLKPLVKEIAEARTDKRILMAVSGGQRARHTMAVALDLGLPVGGIAHLIGPMEGANALTLTALLAKHGAIFVDREALWELPLFLETGMLPIVIGIPPYHFWEPPPGKNPVPTHRSDFGIFEHAEVLGMKRVIYVRDVDGVYDKDPHRYDDAKLIPTMTLQQALESPPPTWPLDPMLFEAWQTARHIEQIQIINGGTPGEFTKALGGEAVGTVITREDSDE